MQEDAEDAAASCIEWLEAHGAVVTHTPGRTLYPTPSGTYPNARVLRYTHSVQSPREPVLVHLVISSLFLNLINLR